MVEDAGRLVCEGMLATPAAVRFDEGCQASRVL